MKEVHPANLSGGDEGLEGCEVLLGGVDRGGEGDLGRGGHGLYHTSNQIPAWYDVASPSPHPSVQMDRKRLKASFVEAIIDTLADEIVALTINPPRYCAFYARPSVQTREEHELWVAHGLFSKNEPGAPSDLTVVRMPDEEGGWSDMRAMFLTHLEAAQYVNIGPLSSWGYAMDFAFVFSNNKDSLPIMARPEQLTPFERVETVTGLYMIMQSNLAILGPRGSEVRLSDNLGALDDQIVPAIARMLGRFYPHSHHVGSFTNFVYPN
jgi:hypothetical protein